MRFSANIGMLFREQPFLERITSAETAGFSAVEFPFPYAHQAEEIADRCRRSGQKVVLFNFPPGDLDRGERGLASDPDRRGEFQDSVGLALEYARVLGCGQLNCLSGILQSGIDVEIARETLVDNLRFAGQCLAEHGVVLLTEPINNRDMPGFFLNRVADARSVIEQVGLPNAKLQCDLYHMEVMGEPLLESIGAHIERIGHLQIADFPGRNEPGTGRIDFPEVFEFIESLGYSGWIGCEYCPIKGTAAGLAWLDNWR